MSKVNPASSQEALASVKSFLSENQPHKAIEFLLRTGTGNSELRNAYGVSLMRAGQLDKALDVYQSLCLSSTVCFKSDASALHLVNYATLLLLKGNLRGCLAILRKPPLRSYPSAQRLRDAIQRWRRSLSWTQRVRLFVSEYTPEKPVDLGGQPGELVNGTGT